MISGLTCTRARSQRRFEPLEELLQIVSEVCISDQQVLFERSKIADYSLTSAILGRIIICVYRFLTVSAHCTTREIGLIHLAGA